MLFARCRPLDQLLARAAGLLHQGRGILTQLLE